MNMAGVDSPIHKVLDLGVNLYPGAGPAPFQDGVTHARVSMVGPISAGLRFYLFIVLTVLCRVSLLVMVSREMPTPPKDAATREVKHASNEKAWAQREREREREREKVWHATG
jgi:hypothetical protein